MKKQEKLNIRKPPTIRKHPFWNHYTVENYFYDANVVLKSNTLQEIFIIVNCINSKISIKGKCNGLNIGSILLSNFKILVEI